MIRSIKPVALVKKDSSLWIAMDPAFI